MASTNPANFANLPKDELREIAAKGGHASHGSHGGASNEHSSTDDRPRNADGTFASIHDDSHPDRNPDGTFTKGSELAKELGAKGGHVAHEHQAHKKEVDEEGRNPDGTFKKGSELAHELGVKGGHAAHQQ